MSPGLASPSAPSEQSMLPLTGAVSGGHIGPTQYYNNTFCKHLLHLHAQFE